MFFKILTLLALLPLPISNFIDTLYNSRWQPYHLHAPIVLKSGSLNVLEPSGPVQACNVIALPLPIYFSSKTWKWVVWEGKQHDIEWNTWQQYTRLASRHFKVKLFLYLNDTRICFKQEKFLFKTRFDSPLIVLNINTCSPKCFQSIPFQTEQRTRLCIIESDVRYCFVLYR
jgi:hypothetical protein